MEHTQNLELFKYNTDTDGKEVFSIDKALNENWDKIDNLFAKLYPVGAIYLSVTDTCPLEGIVGHWELVSSNRALWGSNGTNADTTIAAGLPNITGNFWEVRGDIVGANGCFYLGNTGDKDHGQTGTINGRKDIGLDASRSSTIYGNSDTVQPPAYVVNVWKRIS